MTRVDTADKLRALEEIRQVKARYLRLMDEKRWEDWSDVFTEDCHFTVAAGGGPVETTIDGRDEIVAFWRDALADRLSIHHGHMPEITVRSDAAASGLWSCEYLGELTPGSMVRIYGVYDDDFEKGGDGTWRIKRLHINRIRLEEID